MLFAASVNALGVPIKVTLKTKVGAGLEFLDVHYKAWLKNRVDGWIEHTTWTVPLVCVEIYRRWRGQVGEFRSVRQLSTVARLAAAAFMAEGGRPTRNQFQQRDPLPLQLKRVKPITWQPRTATK